MGKRAAKEIPITDSGEMAPAAPVRSVTMLEQVIGQGAAKKNLRAAMESGRVHHAWVFHGPAGVGKFSTAVAFAAALLDPTTSPDLSGNLAPEADSQVQRLVRAGNHPDLHVITKELAAMSREQKVRDSKQSGIAKDVVEEFVTEPASKSRIMPGDSRAGKVFIVDEAELLSAISQNTLLKTLEEPPAGTVMILITSAEERLLPTIRSRCQRVGFTPLDEKEMERWLGTLEAAKGLTKERRGWLLKFAGGSPGAAEVAIANDLFEWGEALRPAMDEIEKGRFPMGLGSTMAKLIDERAATAVKANPDASKDAANKAWARRMLGFVAEDVRGRLRVRMGGAAGKSAEQVEADPVAQRWLNAVDAIAAAEGHLAMNVNMGLLLENLVAQMSAEPATV